MLISLVQLRCQYFKITTTARKYRDSSCVYSLATKRQYEFREKKICVKVIVLGGLFRTTRCDASLLCS